MHEEEALEVDSNEVTAAVVDDDVVEVELVSVDRKDEDIGSVLRTGRLPKVVRDFETVIGG